MARWWLLLVVLVALAVTGSATATGPHPTAACAHKLAANQDTANSCPDGPGCRWWWIMGRACLVGSPVQGDITAGEAVRIKSNPCCVGPMMVMVTNSTGANGDPAYIAWAFTCSNGLTRNGGKSDIYSGEAATLAPNFPYGSTCVLSVQAQVQDAPSGTSLTVRIYVGRS